MILFERKFETQNESGHIGYAGYWRGGAIIPSIRKTKQMSEKSNSKVNRKAQHAAKCEGEEEKLHQT